MVSFALLARWCRLLSSRIGARVLFTQRRWFSKPSFLAALHKSCSSRVSLSLPLVLVLSLCLSLSPLRCCLFTVLSPSLSCREKMHVPSDAAGRRALSSIGRRGWTHRRVRAHERTRPRPDTAVPRPCADGGRTRRASGWPGTHLECPVLACYEGYARARPGQVDGVWEVTPSRRRTRRRVTASTGPAPADFYPGRTHTQYSGFVHVHGNRLQRSYGPRLTLCGKQNGNPFF